MAWNPSPKVKDCREIGRKWGCQQVLIIGIDQVTGNVIGASYGDNKELCKSAGKALDFFCEQIECGEVTL